MFPDPNDKNEEEFLQMLHDRMNEYKEAKSAYDEEQRVKYTRKDFEKSSLLFELEARKAISEEDLLRRQEENMNDNNKLLVNYDEQRLINLKTLAYSVKYGINLMRKYPDKFDFSQMILNFAQYADTINESEKYQKDITEVIAFIFNEYLLSQQKHIIEEVFNSLLSCFDMKLKFSEESIICFFEIFKKYFKNSTTDSRTSETFSRKIVGNYAITEDIFFDYCDIINPKYIDKKLNNWANPWYASDRFRSYIVMNGLDN